MQRALKKSKCAKSWQNERVRIRYDSAMLTGNLTSRSSHFCTWCAATARAEGASNISGSFDICESSFHWIEDRRMTSSGLICRPVTSYIVSSLLQLHYDLPPAWRQKAVKFTHLVFLFVMNSTRSAAFCTWAPGLPSRMVGHVLHRPDFIRLCMLLKVYSIISLLRQFLFMIRHTHLYITGYNLSPSYALSRLLVADFISLSRQLRLFLQNWFISHAKAISRLRAFTVVRLSRDRGGCICRSWDTVPPVLCGRLVIPFRGRVQYIWL